jgi:hypothetical protein
VRGRGEGAVRGVDGSAREGVVCGREEGMAGDDSMCSGVFNVLLCSGVSIPACFASPAAAPLPAPMLSPACPPHHVISVWSNEERGGAARVNSTMIPYAPYIIHHHAPSCTIHHHAPFTIPGCTLLPPYTIMHHSQYLDVLYPLRVHRCFQCRVLLR